MSNDPVEAQRRRRGSGPSGRAEAPRRETGASGGGGSQLPPGQYPSGGGGQYPTGGGGRSGGLKLPIGVVIVIAILYFGYTLLSGGGGDTSQQTNPPDLFPTQPEILPTNESAVLPQSNYTPPAAVSGAGQRWLVMLYQDADDQILEQDIFVDLNEAERVGSSERVQIVAQIDRYRSGFSGDGNWTGARRYFVTQDNDLNRIGSRLVDDLGEVNMSDGQTLVDFVDWAAKNYPADRYVLILSDHGMGWPGGWSDGDSGGRDSSSVPLASRLNDNIYTFELDKALAKISQDTGIDQFDIIGMDACLMSQVEVLAALQPHARYAVLSEETEPSLGWAYASFLGDLVSNPDMTSEQFSSRIVSSYVDADQRVTDPRARADFLAQNSPMGGLFGGSQISAAQLADQLGRNVTLTAVDLTKLPGLLQSLNGFAYSLQSEDQGIIASARNYAQSYTSIFGKEVPPSFIDLGSFAQLVRKQTRESTVQQSVDQLLVQIKAVIVAEKHGAAKPGSTGIAIYFPNSTLYRSPVTGAQSYTGIADRFARETLWDDFLAFHYNDRSFDQRSVESVVPPAGGVTRAPGQGAISVDNFKASANSVAPGGTVRLTADITGTNVGHVYLFVGYFDSASNSIYVADTDYLESPQTREVDGVYYPSWSEQPSFSLAFNWDPIVFAISDGSKTVPALFSPQSYGASANLAAYTVEGTYTFADSGNQVPARLYFVDGKLRQAFGFTQGEAGAPTEITPQTGDQFTVSETWYELDSSGGIAKTVTEQGETLNFGNDMFTWQELYAAPGNYIVGFLVADMDGNITPVYTQIEVK